jgi:hypothetical protein
MTSSYEDILIGSSCLWKLQDPHIWDEIGVSTVPGIGNHEDRGGDQKLGGDHGEIL